MGNGIIILENMYSLKKVLWVMWREFTGVLIIMADRVILMFNKGRNVPIFNVNTS